MKRNKYTKHKYLFIRQVRGSKIHEVGGEKQSTNFHSVHESALAPTIPDKALSSDGPRRLTDRKKLVGSSGTLGSNTDDAATFASKCSRGEELKLKNPASSFVEQSWLEIRDS